MLGYRNQHENARGTGGDTKAAARIVEARVTVPTGPEQDILPVLPQFSHRTNAATSEPVGKLQLDGARWSEQSVLVGKLSGHSSGSGTRRGEISRIGHDEPVRQIPTDERH